MGNVTISLGEQVRGSRVINVNEDNYIELAGRTNQPDYDAVVARMNEGKMSQGLPGLLLDLEMQLNGTLDHIKKNVFYGKELPVDTQDVITNYESLADLDTPDMNRFRNNPEMVDIFHGVVGLATEAGELIKALNEFIRTGNIDLVNLGEEVGDQNWYQALILKRANLTFNQVMTTNIQKLAKRFPHGFTADKAINRDVDAERVILDSGMSEVSGHHFQD